MADYPKKLHKDGHTVEVNYPEEEAQLLESGWQAVEITHEPEDKPAA